MRRLERTGEEQGDDVKEEAAVLLGEDEAPLEGACPNICKGDSTLTGELPFSDKLS